ncbi:MAG: RNA polymerase sigma factor [Bacteroidetes bacterium]|nr:RNA polymerase sigma factor [Bacteroidota bacterium]
MLLEEEKELLEKIRADKNQFGILFDHYYQPIFGYAFRRVADYDLARDISAETFLKAFLKIKTFEWKGIPLSSWLYRIATNEVNQYFRKQKYRPEKLGSIVKGESYFFFIDNGREELEEELIKHGEFLEIQLNLKKLDTKYQEVIALRYFEGRDNKQIADILEKPEGTIKSLLSRGIEKLKILCNQ